MSSLGSRSALDPAGSRSGDLTVRRRMAVEEEEYVRGMFQEGGEEDEDGGGRDEDVLDFEV